MGGKHAFLAQPSGASRRRVRAAVIGWALAFVGVQAELGETVGRAARNLDEQIELELRERSLRAPAPMEHDRGPHDDPIDPWELVSV
jgi:hypothetical protein